MTSTSPPPTLSPSAGPAPTPALPSPTTAALTDLATMTPSLIPFGIALGVTTTSLGFSPGFGLFGAAVMYAGGSQLSMTTLLAGGTGAVATILAAIVVNARLALYGAALEPHFRRQSRLFRLLAPHFIIDASYLAVIGRDDLADPDRFRRYWWRFGLGLLVVWVGSVAIGVLVGPAVPDLPHLGLMGTALFLAMLTPRLTNRPAVAATLAAATVGPLIAQVLPNLAMLAGTAAGVLAGVLTERGTR